MGVRYNSFRIINTTDLVKEEQEIRV